MRTDNIPVVVTVKKINEDIVCLDQFGNKINIDKEDSKNGIPGWRYNKALKGKFLLIRKYNKNNIACWKKYDSNKDGDVFK